MKWLLTACFAVLPALADCELPSSSLKVQTARAVFEDIVQAAGTGERPTLVVVPPGCIGLSGPERGAWYEEKTHRVNLDVSLYDMCADAARAFGGERNCLAFLLGHELAHVFREHYRTSTLASGFSRAGASGSTAAEGAALERDADLFGGIYGYRAGYDSLRHAPEVLEAVYQTYKLSAKLKGYPDLADRKKIAELSLQQLRNLIPIFETGNLMLVLGHYDLAASCFEDLSRKFPSREMFNNRGVSYALAYASLRDPNAVPNYPWIVDSDSRVQLSAESNRGDLKNIPESELFDRARQAFTEAKRLDPEYMPAYLNLACLYDLHKTGDKHAGIELEDALEHKGALEHKDALEHQESYPALEQAVRLARRIIETHPPRAPSPPSAGLEIAEEEQMGDQTASAALDQPLAEGATRIAGEPPLSIGPVKQYDTYAILPVQGAGKRWAFLSTDRGARVGTTLAELNKMYCAPDQMCGAELSTARGRYVRFQNARAIFVLDAKGKVVKCILYAEK